MPYSYLDYKFEVRIFFEKNIPSKSKVLDVGPGVGTYWALFKNLEYKMDCVEIFEPYVERYGLREKYEHVYVANIMEFDFSEYDCVLLGDILEHLSVKDGQKLMERITKNGQKSLVAVPYLFEQGESEGNIYEAHLQPDLTRKKEKDPNPLKGV